MLRNFGGHDNPLKVFSSKTILKLISIFFQSLKIVAAWRLLDVKCEKCDFNFQEQKIEISKTVLIHSCWHQTVKRIHLKLKRRNFGAFTVVYFILKIARNFSNKFVRSLHFQYDREGSVILWQTVSKQQRLRERFELLNVWLRNNWSNLS